MAQVLDTVLKPKVKMTLMLCDKFVMISWTQMKTNDAIRVTLKQNGPEDNGVFLWNFYCQPTNISLKLE